MITYDIINNGFGVINSITDPFNDYNGKISIEYRGSSSLSFPKKSYGLETQDIFGENYNIPLRRRFEDLSFMIEETFMAQEILRQLPPQILIWQK